MFEQSEFALRCEWGERGVAKLAPVSDVVVIVDILSFSTCVEIATNNGAVIFPYPWKDEAALDYAKSIQAELASCDRTHDGYSLAPSSLTKISAGTRLVLPSPNGSFLSLRTGETPTLAGCFRNCKSVADFAQSYGSKIAVIPAGEKWEDGSLRPAFEDLIGAGAVLSHLSGRLSPEARAAVAAFHSSDNLLTSLKSCSSGKELISRGFVLDIELAAAVNISNCVPLFTGNVYTRQEAR